MAEQKHNLLWVRCPKCRSKTRLKVHEDTVLLNFPLFCPSCKRETDISVVKLEMLILKEPDA